MELKEIITTVGLGAGGWIVLNFITFYPSVEAVDYFEVTGYLNGLVRAAGNKAAALQKLDEWWLYHVDRAPWAGVIIKHFYNYGVNRAKALYD